MSEQVEWHVGYRDDNGTLHIAQDGAQSVFSRTNAEKFAKKLGTQWSLFHQRSNLPPAEHELSAQSQTFGSQWAP